MTQINGILKPLFFLSKLVILEWTRNYGYHNPTFPVIVDLLGRITPVSAGPLLNPVPEFRRESFVEESAESVVVPLEDDKRSAVECGRGWSVKILRDDSSGTVSETILLFFLGETCVVDSWFRDCRWSSAFKASILAKGGGVSFPPNVGSIAVSISLGELPNPASRSTSLLSRIQFWRWNEVNQLIA